MKDFYDITNAVCKETNPTASLILPLQGKVLKKCDPKETDSEFVKQIKSAISTKFSKRYQEPDVRAFLEKSSALDPRTKSKTIISAKTSEELTEEVFFYSVLRPIQDYFSSYETGQSVGGAKTGEPREKHLTHPQAELGLSHMWPERGSNPHQTQR